LNFRGLRGLRRAKPGDTAAERCSIWASRNALAISVMQRFHRIAAADFERFAHVVFQGIGGRWGGEGRL